MRVFRLLRILAVVWRYRLDEIVVSSLKNPTLVRVVRWTTFGAPRETRGARLRQALALGSFAAGTSADGAFQVEDLAPGVYDLSLWIVGGGNVASQFADAGLLDEVAVTIVPVVLGVGKPLFDRRLPGGAMQLTGVFPRANGMVELRYAIRN